MALRALIITLLSVLAFAALASDPELCQGEDNCRVPEAASALLQSNKPIHGVSGAVHEEAWRKDPAAHHQQGAAVIDSSAGFAADTEFKAEKTTPDGYTVFSAATFTA
mmetsp:Transcript_4100/g.11997  ORF Transcript_4100/g.11997 Transcript_4100/m.11997 type:complete len:108 (-) Transcript_4100:70-393(-)